MQTKTFYGETVGDVATDRLARYGNRRATARRDDPEAMRFRVVLIKTLLPSGGR